LNPQTSSRLTAGDPEATQSRRPSQDSDLRRSRSTGTTPRSSGRKHRSSLHHAAAAKDAVDAPQRKADPDATSSSDDDDRCRILPDLADDDYLERLDRKVSEVISRSRLGNLPSSSELGRSNSEHYGPLSLSYNARALAKKSSPGTAHRMSRTPRTSESTVVQSTSSATTTLPDTEGSVRFGGGDDDNDGDSSDTLESSPEDFSGVAQAGAGERWSDVDVDVEDESAEGDDEDNNGVVLRRRR
jgi:hypothetical protein